MKSVPRAESLRWVPTGAATLGSAIAWSDWLTSQESASLVLAVVMQAVAGAVVAWMATPQRRVLIWLVALSVPVIGPLASMYIDSERGRGGAELLEDPTAEAPTIDGIEIARRLTQALPPCEALVSGNVDARRATITRLSQRAKGEYIAILRWARNQRDSELAVDAALALADLEQRFELRLRTARASVAASPCYATHASLVTTICDGVLAGIVDAPIVTKLVSEARRHHLEASVADPEAARELVVPCGRLELAARRPDLALALAKRALSRSANPELVHLYSEAAYAARRFDLVPGLRSREADVRAS